ncbi:MAG: hypothetical protein ACRDSP_21430 [Pseudonocardiaceae bacterium]
MSSLTCTVDGQAHLVSDDAAAAGILAGQGIYTALCGHLVHVAAMASSAGPQCPRCTVLAGVVGESAGHEPARRRRDRPTRLRRLLGQRRAASLPR